MADGAGPLPIEYEHAKIVRDMIQHENTLQNYRITWLTTVQGLLIAGLGFAWDKQDSHWHVFVFAILGILVAMSSWSALRLGKKAFTTLVEWWDAHKGTYPGPTVYGYRAPEEGPMYYLRPWWLLPWIFVGAWLAILIINIPRADKSPKSKIVIDQERQLNTFSADFKQ